jgi:hypothetical protein
MHYRDALAVLFSTGSVARCLLSVPKGSPNGQAFRMEYFLL